MLDQDGVIPKAFISYSWTNEQWKEQIKEWADRLLQGGVNVVLDRYDLKEGQDKYAFMERMVTDDSVSHVLVFSDEAYAQKADARQAGVGTESQIISKEVYEQVDQTKFIPVVCEYELNGEPCLPTYLKSRKYIDFSTPERAHRNWEQLVRTLHGIPKDAKPSVGTIPSYLRDNHEDQSSPATVEFGALRDALLRGAPSVTVYRQEFLDKCVGFADSLRVREKPDQEPFAEAVLADCRKLKLVRDHIVDWVLLEAQIAASDEFTDALLLFLEKVLGLKAKPPELHSWNENWFEAQRLFGYETFLYIIASLLKLGAFNILHRVFTHYYLLPESERSRGRAFVRFDEFFTESQVLQELLAPEGQRLLSPAGELVKRHSDREDVPFTAILEAELLCIFMTVVLPPTYWAPGILYYTPMSYDSPFFLRATHQKGFDNLAIVTGIESVEELRTRVQEAYESQPRRYQGFTFRHRSLLEMANIDKLATLP